jgi:hypothetical protein
MNPNKVIVLLEDLLRSNPSPEEVNVWIETHGDSNQKALWAISNALGIKYPVKYLRGLLEKKVVLRRQNSPSRGNPDEETTRAYLKQQESSKRSEKIPESAKAILKEHLPNIKMKIT